MSNFVPPPSTMRESAPLRSISKIRLYASSGKAGSPSRKAPKYAGKLVSLIERPFCIHQHAESAQFNGRHA